MLPRHLAATVSDSPANELARDFAEGFFSALTQLDDEPANLQFSSVGGKTALTNGVAIGRLWQPVVTWAILAVSKFADAFLR